MKKSSLTSKTVGVYSPFLDVLGGGEKHLFAILEVFSQKGATVSFFWKENLSSLVFKRFGFDFVKKANWLSVDLIKTSWRKMIFLRKFDYFFYVPDGSYFFSTAKKNFIFAMVPDKKLYSLHLLNRLKLLNYQFLSNSPYTSEWLKRWGIRSFVILPYVSEEFFLTNKSIKEKIILVVGRFFPHLHSKNHEKAIEIFVELKKKSPLFKDYRLILVGGLKKEDHDYFNHLRFLSKKNSHIVILPNLSLRTLLTYYHQARYLWHFTGLGVDEARQPERVEHLGLAPLEAAASGCFILCHRSGGPRKLFRHQPDVLFENEKELVEKMVLVEKYPSLRERIIKNNLRLIRKKFTRKVFSRRVSELF
ncbi:MAG: glycosyltransferase family 4 protein [Patescibacteria group bacterium]|nr:glycosyltransferase family 4 protein [Patescibacteria group bacterium]